MRVRAVVADWFALALAFLCVELPIYLADSVLSVIKRTRL